MTLAIAQPKIIAFQRATTAESTDESLVERIARQDQLAMRALFARHRVRVYRFALHLVKDETLNALDPCCVLGGRNDVPCRRAAKQ